MHGINRSGFSSQQTAGVDSEREMPVVIEGVGITSTAIVEAIDLDNRVLTLRTEDDETISMKVSEEVRNLPQVKVGDRIVTTYEMGLALALSPADSSNGLRKRVDTITLERTALSQKPGGELRTTVSAEGVVRAIDPKARTVTLRGAGNTVTLAVAEDIDLSNIKVGDKDDAMYQESFAISVEPAPLAESK